MCLVVRELIAFVLKLEFFLTLTCNCIIFVTFLSLVTLQGSLRIGYVGWLGNVSVQFISARSYHM